MNIRERLTRKLQGLGIEFFGAKPGPRNAKAAPPTTRELYDKAIAGEDLDAFTRRDHEVARAQLEIRQLRVEKARIDADSFVTEQILKGRLYPADRDRVTQTLAQAALDDLNMGTIPRCRVDSFKEMYLTWPAHPFFTERLPAEVSGQRVTVGTNDDVDVDFGGLF